MNMLRLIRPALTLRTRAQIDADPQLKARLDQALAQYDTELAQELAQKHASLQAQLPPD
jgi:hypothetical protein